MHLLIAFAHCSAPACNEVLQALRLPNLDHLLARMQAQAPDTGDEYTLSPPHERAMARARGWTVADGCAPWAAAALAERGAAPTGQAWAWITPCHWNVATDHISMADPEDLHLSEGESRALMQAMQPYFEEDGITLVWDAPMRWLAGGPVFAQLPCASLDRVIGRNIDAWVPASAQAAPLRRLQNEMQMLLYQHPVNDLRLARGEEAVNSFWFSDCGSLPPEARTAASLPIPDKSLRASALREDWQAWAQAWCALDAGPCATLLARLRGGQAARLTLCGERSAQDFAGAPRGLLARLGSAFGRKSACTLLETL
jgi:hypothetical protein